MFLNIGSAEGETIGETSVAEDHAVTRNVFGIGILMERVSHSSRQSAVPGALRNLPVTHNFPFGNPFYDLINSRKYSAIFILCHNRIIFLFHNYIGFCLKTQKLKMLFIRHCSSQWQRARTRERGRKAGLL